ncbi:hypothetical protein T484DRAFT_1824388 [Baffinella frigidus]|nr:hypothetical protein T484DRAFT_1824388 [Cryptophyta sp. CCMP2293]
MVRSDSITTLWYLGIGSMMNADTIAKRNIRPLESSPVRCVDFERRFWGKFGMAEIKERQGAEFHAVLHSVTSEDMAELDRMERGYIRKDITCYKYDGTRVVATGCTRKP